MSNRLVVNPGTPQAWEIPLPAGTTRIGRDPQNDFPIEHASLAATHCEVVVSATGVLLRDLGSAGGTFVDRAAVREVWLRPGQQVQIGAIAMVFEGEPSEPSPTPTPAPINQAAPGAKVVVAGFSPPPATPVRSAGEPQPAAALPRDEFDPQPVASERQPHATADQPAPLGRGLGGAVGGGLLGLVVWALLMKATGSPLGMAAWGVGAAAGLGARLLAKRTSLILGIISVAAALVAIAGGEVFALKVIREKEVLKRASDSYRRQLEFARAAVRIQTTEDARYFLAKHNSKLPSEITDEAVQQFEETELPRLRDFANGNPSEAEFTQRMAAREGRAFHYRNFFLKTKTGLFLTLWAGLGLVSAYKIGAGEDAD